MRPYQEVLATPGGHEELVVEFVEEGCIFFMVNSLTCAAVSSFMIFLRSALALSSERNRITS